MNKKTKELLMLVIGFLYLAAAMNYGLNIYDEGVCGTGAMRILGGELPYKDFWTLYAPGGFYFWAAVMKTIGGGLLGIRFVGIAVWLAVSILIYKTAQNITDSRNAVFAFILTVILAGFAPFYLRALPVALLCVFASVILLIKYFQNTNKYYLLASGLFLGLTTLFRHEMGLYIFVSEISVIFFFEFFRLTGINLFIKSKKGLASAGIYTIGASIFIIPAFMLLIQNISLFDLYEQLIKIPLSIFKDMRNLPFPNILNAISAPSIGRKFYNSWEFFVFFLPPVVYLISIIKTVAALKNKKIKLSEPNIWKIILITIVGTALYSQAMVRSDAEHALPSLLAAILLIIYMISSIKNQKIYSFAAVSILLVVFSYPAAQKIKNIKDLMTNAVEIKSPNAKYIYMKSDEAIQLNKTLSLIRKITNKNDMIYSGLLRHDKIFINNAIFYYLADRMPSVKYHELHPGINVRKEIQREMINDIKKNKTKAVVLWDCPEINEPNQSSVSSKVNDIDLYIQSNFKKNADFGQYSVWIKQ